MRPDVPTGKPIVEVPTGANKLHKRKTCYLASCRDLTFISHPACFHKVVQTSSSYDTEPDRIARETKSASYSSARIKPTAWWS